MKVKELIKLLRRCDQEARVVTRDHDNSKDEISGYVESVAEQHSSEIADWRGNDCNLVVIEG